MTESDKTALEAIRAACSKYFNVKLCNPGKTYAIAKKLPGGEIAMCEPPPNYEETKLEDFFREVEQAIALRTKANQA